jgi:hypothetical protein
MFIIILFNHLISVDKGNTINKYEYVCFTHCHVMYVTSTRLNVFFFRKKEFYFQRRLSSTDRIHFDSKFPCRHNHESFLKDKLQF